ncbi:Uncharacterised protein [Vibrio cholerae]|nr:Uncharacterised protein [Vibrio cholerae]CSC35001.1 Uncharacterised protein [Vibrio cholerae]CSI95974.1 Uncharacterised protein [Vibrio cholerae]
MFELDFAKTIQHMRLIDRGLNVHAPLGVSNDCLRHIANNSAATG